MCFRHLYTVHFFYLALQPPNLGTEAECLAFLEKGLSLTGLILFAQTQKRQREWGDSNGRMFEISVTDPETFDADPDPTFDIDADPDPKLTTYSMYLEKNRTNQIA